MEISSTGLFFIVTSTGIERGVGMGQAVAAAEGGAEDGARLGFLALGEEGEVLVADLLDVEQPALGTDICLTQVLDAVNDCRANGARETVVVRFANAAEGGDVCLVEEVLGVICTVNTT